MNTMKPQNLVFYHFFIQILVRRYYAPCPQYINLTPRRHDAGSHAPWREKRDRGCLQPFLKLEDKKDKKDNHKISYRLSTFCLSCLLKKTAA